MNGVYMYMWFLFVLTTDVALIKLIVHVCKKKYLQ